MVEPLAAGHPVSGAEHTPTGDGRLPWRRRDITLEMGLLLVMCAWAGNFIAMKTALVRMPPVGYSLISFAIGSGVLLLLAAAHDRRLLLPRRQLVMVAALGGLTFGVNQILFPTGLSMTTAANGALLVGTSPLLVMLVSSVIRTERITVTKLLGAFVSLAGVALVVTADGNLSIGDRLLGDVLVLGAALSWATYIGLSALVLRAVPPLLATGWAMAAASVVILPVGALQLASAWNEVRAEDLVAVTYTGLANGLGNALVFLAVQRLGATRVTQMQFLIPGLVVVLAAMLLAEPISVAQVAGGALIIVGIAWARRRRTLVVSTDPQATSDVGGRAGAPKHTSGTPSVSLSEPGEARVP